MGRRPVKSEQVAQCHAAFLPTVPCHDDGVGLFCNFTHVDGASAGQYDDEAVLVAIGNFSEILHLRGGQSQRVAVARLVGGDGVAFFALRIAVVAEEEDTNVGLTGFAG